MSDQRPRNLCTDEQGADIGYLCDPRKTFVPGDPEVLTDLYPLFTNLLARVNERPIPIEGPALFSLNYMRDAMLMAYRLTGSPITDVILSGDLAMMFKSDPQVTSSCTFFGDPKDHLPGQFGTLGAATLWDLDQLNPADQRVRELKQLPSMILKGRDWHFFDVHPLSPKPLADYSDQRLLQILLDRAPSHWETYVAHLKLAQRVIGEPK